MSAESDLGHYERWLIAQEGARLARQARSFTLAAGDVDDRFSDSALDAGQACMREAESLRQQLDRPARKRPPRGGRSR